MGAHCHWYVYRVLILSQQECDCTHADSSGGSYDSLDTQKYTPTCIPKKVNTHGCCPHISVPLAPPQSCIGSKLCLALARLHARSLKLEAEYAIAAATLTMALWMIMSVH